MSFRRGWISALIAGVLVSSAACATEPAGPDELWVANYLAQCNEFDEPYRECMLISHGEFEPYRHMEGTIEGFEYAEGTRYQLEVEPSDLPNTVWRLVRVISTE